MKKASIGEFIQGCRKDKNLTQKELAGLIGVSDKVISKWETGNSIPDTQILAPLCKALEISINELLSAEKLPPNEYSFHAEENIMDLIKENENHKKGSNISLAIGILLGILGLVLIFGISAGSIAWFFDIPSLVSILIICTAIMLMSKCNNALERLKTFQKACIPTGALIFFVGIISILGQLSDLTKLGPNLAVALISPIYALILYLILIPIIKIQEDKYTK